MLKEKIIFFRKGLFVADLCATIVSFLLAYLIRNSLSDGFLGPLVPFSEYIVLMIPVIALWGFLLHWVDAYAGFRTARASQAVLPVIKVVAIGTFGLSFCLFFFKIEAISRIVIALFAALNLAMLCGMRVGILAVLRNIRRRGYNSRNLLVVGTGRRALEFAEMVQSHPEWGIRIQGYLDRKPALLGQQVNGHRVVGLVDDLPRILDRQVIDEVVFIVPRAWLNGIEGAVRLCEEQGVKTSIALDLYDLAVARPLVTELEGMPMLTYSTTPSSEGKLALKRAIDLIGSAFLLLVVSPLFLIIAAAIKLTSKGPVFFRQTRVGLNGRHFILLKFRSMVVDAEQRLREIAHLNEMDGPVFKVRHDPRVTPVGRLLRKTSLDELPQLINVLRGEMSLVGPRPPVPSEVVAYAPWQKRRLSMKPGITCLWQVNGRNTIDFDQWMKLDLEYIDNWSLGLDLKIVGKTVPAVLLGKGAS
jgi:exopolysaccharide biosynthesis polyprenyl glycosylphosphotransferase